jgi:hypothetical protein
MDSNCSAAASPYLLDGHRVFNTGDDAHWALALLAGFNVDIEYSFQPLGPGHRHVPLGEAAIILRLADTR